jgi:type VI secretion system secreted protein Hcp
MKMDKIDGDVTAKGHEKWIDLHSFQWGVGRGIGSPVGRGAERESSAPSLSEVTVTKDMDASSPYLFTEAVIGKTKKVVIEFVKTSGDQLETYLVYTLTNVLVSGYSVSSGGDKPSESLSLNYTKFEMKYTPQKGDANAGSPIPAGYDLAAATKV